MSAYVFLLSLKYDEKILLIAAGLLLFRATSFCQLGPGDSVQIMTSKPERQNPYFIKPAVDIPMAVAGGAFTLYNFSRISKKTASSQPYIESLNKNNVNWFDRWGVRPYNEKRDNISYMPFFVAMPLPLVVFAIDNKMRKDFFKLSFLYAEAMVVTGVLYSTAAGYTNRLRPMVYDPETPLQKRLNSEQKKSFFAGHGGTGGYLHFFIAEPMQTIILTQI